MPFTPAPLQQLQFSKKISEDDWMYKGKTSYGYFLRGYDALLTIANIMHTATVKPRDVLDFGCGHGCVSRMLKAQYPQATIVGQDVNQAWLDWCSDNLGIETILSEAHIRSVSVDQGSYDLIWVGSVFTHIPEQSFDYLLDVLVSGLKERGILIFTTAGEMVRASFDVNNEKLLAVEDAKKAVYDYDERGYGFAPYTGGTYSDWGRAMVRFSRVYEKVKLHPVRLVSFLESGWGRRQDIYAVQRV